MSLADKILAWANSPAGKERIKAEMKTAIASGKEFGGFSSASADVIAQDLYNYICAAVPPALSGGFSGSVSVAPTKEGYFEINVSFDKESLHRPSLLADSPGVYDIFGLFSKGYTIPKNRRHPYGIWHGKPTWALMHREANPFIAAAVDSWASLNSGKYNIISTHVNEAYR